MPRIERKYEFQVMEIINVKLEIECLEIAKMYNSIEVKESMKDTLHDFLLQMGEIASMNSRGFSFKSISVDKIQWLSEEYCKMISMED